VYLAPVALNKPKLKSWSSDLIALVSTPNVLSRAILVTKLPDDSKTFVDNRKVLSKHFLASKFSVVQNLMKFSHVQVDSSTNSPMAASQVEMHGIVVGAVVVDVAVVAAVEVGVEVVVVAALEVGVEVGVEVVVKITVVGISVKNSVVSLLPEVVGATYPAKCNCPFTQLCTSVL